MLTDTDSVEKLKQQLPGVTIRIIARENETPDLSGDLKQHLAKVRQNLLDRLDQQIAAGDKDGAK